MIASRAPVIDLCGAVEQSRSILFQLARIEAHLAALPGHEVTAVRARAGSTTLIARMRTTDAATIDGRIARRRGGADETV
jgi:uncharacterized alpha-E superfamily protein